MYIALLISVCIHIVLCEDSLFSNTLRESWYHRQFSRKAGYPLLLTPLIEQNKIQEAQKAAEVTLNGVENIKSYSGFLTVNKQFNSNMFFWYFPSRNNAKTDPVILWLQGGPGASSMFGLFAENGPFFAKSRSELELREYAWTNMYSVIYIDNPVGTGFSFTNEGYARNQTQVGDELYKALIQFFKLFHDLQHNKFFISGESYAGKYIPALGYTIHKNNPSAELKINLQGLIIGNGLSDPENQLKYGNYLYQLGLIDINQRNIFNQYETQGVKYIQNKEYNEAFKIFDILLNGDLTPYPTLYKNFTGFNNYFNYLHPKSSLPDELSYYEAYLQTTETRLAIHVGDITFGDERVEKELQDDIMQSVVPWISELLSNYHVLIFNGQLDVIVAYPLTVNYLQKLNFSGAQEYKVAPRRHWYVGSDLAGYVKRAGNLTEVMVRSAGHMVAVEQPQWMFDLITKFISNEDF